MTAKEYLSQALNIDRSINSKLEQVASLHELATKATTLRMMIHCSVTSWNLPRHYAWMWQESQMRMLLRKNLVPELQSCMRLLIYMNTGKKQIIMH